MVKNTVARLAGAGALLVLAGCTWTGSVITSDKIDYQAARTRTTPLEVPPDLSQLPRDERFQVPERPQAVTATGGGARPVAAAAPAGSAAAVAPSGVVAKIERQGNQRWLAVNMAPEKAWPILLAFWPSIGLAVDKSDPVAGVMETTWAENRANLPQDFVRSALGRVLDSIYSTGEQDKFRARIERTAQDTSEIFISHRGMVEVYTSNQKDQTTWQPRPTDTELEAEILQRLLVRFDGAAAKPGTAVAAAGTPAAAAAAATALPPKARLIKGADGRTERVEVDESFDRAWRQIGLALDRGGFTVEDRDRAKGLYFVRYLDPEYEIKARQQQGFLTKLFSPDKPIPPPQYRVFVEQQAPNRTAVLVFDKDGKPERTPVGDRILALLSDQMR